jgi:simple sugar transport system permease protein
MRDWWNDNHLRFLIAANLLIVVVAALISGGKFLDPYNFQSMAKQLPEIGLLALGITLAMISGNGGIDLSVVSIANLSAVVAGLVGKAWFGADGQGVAFTIAFVSVALPVGILCGLINGLLISRAGFSPILATLGTQLAFTGLAVALSGGPAVSLGYIEPFVQIGNGSFLGVPISFWMFGVSVAVVAWILGRTRFGLRLYLMGSNAKAAHYTGINTAQVALLTYTLSGFLAAIAGIIFASSSSTAKWDYGGSYLLIAILIAVMGGINPDGGYGKIAGLVLSAAALQMLSSALNLAGMSNFLKDFTWGLLLLLSIIFTNARQIFVPRRSG